MSQVNMHQAGASARNSHQRWYALLVCTAGGFIVFLDVSIVNVALPTISAQLHASTLAPNQSLTLAAVPIPEAGAAGGLYQTGQRIGASIGAAAVGSAFFATLRAGGSFAGAYRNGIIVMSAVVAAALLLALIDRHRAAVPSARQDSA